MDLPGRVRNLTSEKKPALPGYRSFIKHSSEDFKLFVSRFQEAGGDIKIHKAEESMVNLISGLSESTSAVWAGNFDKFPEIASFLEQDQKLSGIADIPLNERKNFLAEINLAILTCDYLIAETGSVVNLCNENTDRLISALPRELLIIAHTSQILPGWEDLFSSVPSHNPPNIMVTTGPSKTADIEKVLITGVHGPGVVKMLLLRNQEK